LRNGKPTSVGEILKDLARKSALGKHLEHAQIWEHWPEIAGQRLSGHGWPKTVRQGALHIEVDSVVWMHAYAYHKWDIIKRANRIAKQELVSDIFIELAPDEEPISPQDGV